MLFDLKADPAEMKNLIQSHAESKILATLRKKCAAQSQALNDRREAFKKTVKIQKR